MNVPLWLWLATIGGLVAIILADLFLVDHKPHAVTAREATRWVLFYVALAVLFGAGLWFFAGAVRRRVLRRLHHRVLALGRQPVRLRHHPDVVRGAAALQHRVLLIGIVIALVLRGAFIAVGAAAISTFTWVFYLFGRSW